VLRSQGELGIKDVVSNLPEYSEKMIQRELAELVAAGRVKKTGLKRWSRYTYIEEV
jgi:DNA-binding HxlR family transcriptional regulator